MLVYNLDPLFKHGSSKVKSRESLCVSCQNLCQTDGEIRERGKKRQEVTVSLDLQPALVAPKAAAGAFPKSCGDHKSNS